MRGMVTVALCALGCAGPPPHPPTAVIDARPATVCEGDDYATVLELSGARSSSALSLVPEGADPDAPLRFDWALEGADHELVAGSLVGPELSVVTAGDRPLHVALTVTNADGGQATSERTVALAECDP